MFAVVYLGAAVLQRAPRHGGARWSGYLALGFGALVLVWGWRAVRVPTRGLDLVTLRGRSSGHVVATGAAIWLGMRFAPPAASFEIAASIGLALAGVGSVAALSHVGSLGGVAAVRKTGRWRAVVVVSGLWVLALGLAMLAMTGQARWTVLGRPAEQFAAVVASLGSMTVTLVAAFQLYAQRRFELGVAERAAAALWLTMFCMVVGLIAALMEVAAPTEVVAAAAFASAIATSMSALSQSPQRVSVALRTVAAMLVLCAPLVSIAVVLAFKAPTHAGVIMFSTTIAAALAGLVAPRLAGHLAPERGRWLRVVADAVRAAKDPDSARAMTRVLSAVREGLGVDCSPMLYRLTAGDCVTVDRAGYLHVDRAMAPSGLLDVSATEPDGVVATETLRSVQVKRTAIRPLVTWLDEREIGAAVVVREDDVAVGLLLWPAAGRVAPLAYDEVVALRQLADHLGAVVGASALLARSRARQVEADVVIGEAEGQVASLRREVEVREARQRALAEMIARPLSIATASPSAQQARVEARRLGTLGMPMALIVSVGGQAMPWCAEAHLASPFSGGPLVFVDGAAPAEQTLARWSEEEHTPLEAAAGGTLVVRHAQALPLETQRYIASALPQTTGLMIVVSGPPDELCHGGWLEERLLDRVRSRVVRLPALAERAEDLRPLAIHMLARAAAQSGRDPVELSLEAQRVLNEYDWPGNETELEAVLLRAALLCEGPTLGADVLESLIGKTVIPPAVSS